MLLDLYGTHLADCPMNFAMLADDVTTADAVVTSLCKLTFHKAITFRKRSLELCLCFHVQVRKTLRYNA